MSSVPRDSAIVETVPEENDPAYSVCAARVESEGACVDGIHDMGGMHGFGPIDVTDTDPSHDPAGPRLQVLAMLAGGFTRAKLEELDPAIYLASHYHERWLIGAEETAVEQGKVSAEDLERWRATFESGNGDAMPQATSPAGVDGLVTAFTTTPLMHDTVHNRFAVNDRVKVKRMAPVGHHRCPRYVRGAIGTVVHVPGSDPLPGHPAGSELEDVYTVRFDSTELWGDRTAEGEPGYDLHIDLCDSYLEPA